MNWSQTLVPTLRDDPQEAEIPSHRLLLRSGMIRRLAGGLYTFLPLGLKALRKVEAIVREEMDRAAALEVLMPAMQPKELWETSGRYEVLGDAMFHVKDRQDRGMVLGPTHEEVITTLAAHEISSYRQLPRTFYQIQTKFRDEIRPRFGLMRAKEFIMKDAYSFDIDMKAADVSYQAMYDAYERIFKRCGLRTKIVEADTGAIGGNWSHEFMVLAETGEDGLVECVNCAYAANLERAERAVADGNVYPDADAEIEPVDTPGTWACAEVTEFFKCDPQRIIKTLIYSIDGNPHAILVSGDREVNEHKLMRLLEARNVELADNDTIQKVTGGARGYSGPVGLKIPVYADFELRGSRGMITGANEGDKHIVNVDLERDASVTAYADLSMVREGDSCPRCESKMQEKRGIEVGHVFKLGTKYSDAFNASYLDENGEKKVMVMGCYGIGVTRTLQAVIEQCYDDNGILWPISVAPYPVSVLALDPDDELCAKTCADICGQLEEAGIDVLIDDRDDRPGVKFKDADLIGLPVRIVISKRSMKESSIELKLRSSDEKQMIPVSNAVSEIKTIVSNLFSNLDNG
jgi:prolyl-tRNA synthetase